MKKTVIISGVFDMDIIEVGDKVYWREKVGVRTFTISAIVKEIFKGTAVCEHTSRNSRKRRTFKILNTIRKVKGTNK